MRGAARRRRRVNHPLLALVAASALVAPVAWRAPGAALAVTEARVAGASLGSAPAANPAADADATAASATANAPTPPRRASAPAADGHAHVHADPSGAVRFRPPTADERAAEHLATVQGRCDGAFVSNPGEVAPPVLAPDLGSPTCTHGGDYVEDVAPLSFAPELAPGYSSPGIPCYGSGPYVHVFYGYRSTSTNRVATLGPRIRETVSRIDDIFANAAAQSGAIRHVRWLMSSCKLVISAVSLSPSLVDGASPGPIRANLISRGLMSSGEKGLIFTDDGDFACSGIAGIAEWADDESTSSSNANNKGGMLARVFGWCWTHVGYIDLAAEVGSHELSHTLGAVGDSAPHSSFRTGGRSHCTDGIDLMCYDDGGGEPQVICAAAFPPTLDCRKDDYFNPSPPGGSYLATHWNPASNRFLAAAAPGSFEVPPRPHATITTPAAGVVAGTVAVGAGVTQASDGAAIVQVEFWLGTTEVGEDTTAPYTASVDTIPDGFGGFPNGAVLKLVAVAVDAHGRTGPSTPVSLTVGNPKVRLTTPAAWTVVPTSPVAWSAAASAGSGRSVAKVELLMDDVVVATDTTAPYGGSVAMDPGQHALRARVTDSGGVTRDTVDRAVTQRSLGPAVTLTSPSPFEFVLAGTGQAQRLAAVAVPEPGRMITSVAFSANGVPVGSDTTSPYEVVWSPPDPGSFDIVATATDSSAATGSSETGSIQVGDAFGTSVSISSPANDAPVSGTVDVSISPTVPAGWDVDSIDVLVDGSTYDTLFGPPWTSQIDLAGLVGRHVLRAVLSAHDATTFDSAVAASAGTVIVLPGALSIVAPANGATVSGTVTVTGSVSGVDPTAVAPLIASLGDLYTVAFLYPPSLSDSFASGELEDGTTSLQLSDSGVGLESAPIAVTLKNATTSLTAPAAGATLTGTTTISATARADGGNLVEQVRFRVDGVDVGGDWTAPYQLSWNPASVANGTHSLRADALLTDGRTIASASRSVSVKVGGVTRLSGPDRYATAAAISKASFAAGVPAVYIATGLNFPDALAGAAVAGHVGAPVLLVPGTSIPTVVATELTRLKPAKIVVLGSAGSVSDGVKTALAAYLGP